MVLQLTCSVMHIIAAIWTRVEVLAYAKLLQGLGKVPASMATCQALGATSRMQAQPHLCIPAKLGSMQHRAMQRTCLPAALVTRQWTSIVVPQLVNSTDKKHTIQLGRRLSQ